MFNFNKKSTQTKMKERAQQIKVALKKEITEFEKEWDSWHQPARIKRIKETTQKKLH